MITLIVAFTLMLAVAGLAGSWASRKQRRLAAGESTERTEARHARDHRQRA